MPAPISLFLFSAYTTATSPAYTHGFHFIWLICSFKVILSTPLCSTNWISLPRNEKIEFHSWRWIKLCWASSIGPLTDSASKLHKHNLIRHLLLRRTFESAWQRPSQSPRRSIAQNSPSDALRTRFLLLPIYGEWSIWQKSLSNVLKEHLIFGETLEYHCW